MQHRKIVNTVQELPKAGDFFGQLPDILACQTLAFMWTALNAFCRDDVTHSANLTAQSQGALSQLDFRRLRLLWNYVDMCLSTAPAEACMKALARLDVDLSAQEKLKATPDALKPALNYSISIITLI